MEALFQETRIKSLTLANRFVRSATWLALAGKDGEATEALGRCWEDLARGRVGLIISGYAFVSREGQGPEGQLGLHNDALIPGLQGLVDRVHGAGGKIVAQIVHCGNQSKKENNGGLDVLGPSDLRQRLGKKVARAMTGAELQRIIRDFGEGARRAREAGFDGVQLHYAHGYLASQFLCPRYNRREDDYGGSLENRGRFLREVYQKVRAAVGEDYPVMAKLNLEDFLDDGLTRDEGLQVAKDLADLGLDALEVSGGMAASGSLGPARRMKDGHGEAYFLDNAVAAKKATGLPVMLVGGLRDPEAIARIHRETGLDYFSLSRPLIQDPGLIARWQEGDLSPAGCVSCSGCFLSVKKGRGVFCVKNWKNKQR